MIVDGDDALADKTVAETNASMGPSMIVDGDVKSAASTIASAVASMGPSMIVDGDSVAWMPGAYGDALQWGRR